MKLEAIRRKHDADEQLNARLESADHPKLLAEVIKEKLSCDDVECDQAILDQHVSRVWDDCTPCRSPGRPKSPDSRRKGKYFVLRFLNKNYCVFKRNFAASVYESPSTAPSAERKGRLQHFFVRQRQRLRFP